MTTIRTGNNSTPQHKVFENLSPQQLHSILSCLGQVIDELEKETEKARAIREMEERLMASAFYDLGMKLHRGAVEDRLKNLSQGQSFLARQRQVLPH